MKMEQMNFINDYIKQLERTIDDYNSDNPFIDENSLFDIVRETVKIFSNDFTELENSIVLKNGTAISDANIVIGILKKHLVENGFKEEIKLIPNGLTKFWKAFGLWIETELPGRNILKSIYERYDNWNGGTYYPEIDYNYEYNLHYGIDFDDENISMQKIKMFVELAYSEWIKIEARYEFTKGVNRYFKSFKIPCKLKNGKIVNQGYKTTHNVDKIIDYSMLERKIAFAEDMILSNEVLDKKCALDYIIDSLQYMISIQPPEKPKKEKYASAAKTVCSNQDSKVYSVINSEIDELMKISNDYFDIRHNDYLTSSKQTREPLVDPIFIEYLYNRAYSLLYILRLKHK